MAMSFSEEVRLAENMAKEFGLRNGNKAIDVKVSVNRDELSILKLMLDVEGAPDTHNPNLPGSPTVRPVHILLQAFPDDGVWGVGIAIVRGPKVHATTENPTKRFYDATFVNPMDEDSKTPEWLLRICQWWVMRLNGPGGMLAFQLYASAASLVCERCDANVTYGDEDPRLSSLNEAAENHVCDPARVEQNSATAPVN